MGLRIIEREVTRQNRLREQLLFEEANRFGAFKGTASAEVHAEFIEKIRHIRDQFTTPEEAQAIAEQLEEAIRKENRRSMIAVGNIQPEVVLDLL